MFVYQVLFYKVVLVWFWFFMFFWSIFIGLDCVGCWWQMRVFNIFLDGGIEFFVLVDDNGSEEDLSYEDFCQVSFWYLQFGGEQLVINELISDGNVVCVEVLWDYVIMDDQELGFKVGDVIQVLEVFNKDWWWGCSEDKEVWFFVSFVRL